MSCTSWRRNGHFICQICTGNIFSSDYTPVLSSEEKSWLEEHGAIRMGFLANDVGASVMDPSSGTLTGAITDYVQYAVECLGKQELTFTLMGYNSYEEEIEAAKSWRD